MIPSPDRLKGQMIVGGFCVDSFTDFDDVRLVTWDGRVFRFEFSHRFGPLMIGKSGRTVDVVPSTRSPFWKALEQWED